MHAGRGVAFLMFCEFTLQVRFEISLYNLESLKVLQVFCEP